MRPRIASGDEVVVCRVDPALVEVGDIVLVRVAGSVYLHLVSAIDVARQRVQIANASGHVNGWTGWAKVHGIATVIAGTPVPGAAAKTVS